MEREEGEVYIPCSEQNYVKFAKSRFETEMSTEREVEKIIKFISGTV